MRGAPPVVRGGVPGIFLGIKFFADLVLLVLAMIFLCVLARKSIRDHSMSEDRGV